DRRPSPELGRIPLSAGETRAAIAWLRRMATAILAVLGGPLTVAVPASQARRPGEEHDLLAALDAHATPELREALLAVYRHAEAHPAFRGFSFGAAAYPSVSASFRIGTSE